MNSSIDKIETFQVPIVSVWWMNFYFNDKECSFYTYLFCYTEMRWFFNGASAILVKASSKNELSWPTDKRTDVWSRNFMIWKIDFGLWAVAWAGPWEKGVWADSEQLFWVVFSIFHGQKIKKYIFYYLVASALKSCIK